MANFKITLTFNNLNLGKAVNVFHFRNASGNPTDAQLLSESTDYCEDVYGPLLAHMENSYTFLDGEVTEVGDAGATIRIVGSISPSISGTIASDMLPLTTAASMFARTNTPKVRGSKRMGGIVEPRTTDALFLNNLLTALASCALEYISSRGTILTWIFRPGVLSTVLETFVDFSGSAVVTNIPGTQVTRKPLRGS